MTFARITVDTIRCGAFAAALTIGVAFGDSGASAQDVSKAAPSVTVPAEATPAPPAITPPATATPAAPVKAARMERLPGVWVEGGGYVIKYGGNYDACTKLCLDDKSCLMIEYYRPEKKCNLYKQVRPLLKGGDADVAVRR
jgi:hypothetical protein